MKTWIGALILGAMVAASGPAAQNRVLVLEGGTLIDGTGRRPVADAVVVVEGERINAVGTKGRIAYPPNATVITLNRRTILPGLIDGHVHLRDYQVPMFLPYGITTIADIHNDTAWSIAQREALTSRKIYGPRMFVSGARVTGPLGAPTTDGSFVRTPDEARAYVRKLAAAGVDHVKVDLTILAATDTGCCAQIVPGASLHEEMQMLTDIGIPPMKAIQGATLWSAEVIGREKDLGSVEPGKLADFTIVEGNPLADITATGRVRMVIKGGEVMDTTYDPTWVNPIPRSTSR